MIGSQMWKRVSRVVHLPAVNIAVGLFMVVSGLIDIAGDLFGDFFGGSLPFGAAHGVLAVGVLHTIKAIPEVAEGVGKVEGARARARRTPVRLDEEE